MKAGWRLVPLGEVCQVIGGGTPPKNIAKYYEGKIPWATVRDMRSETITETECNITIEAVKGSATNIIPAGNVVIATRVGLGKVCLLAQDTAINQDLRGIVPIDLKTISIRFLFYWLKSVSQLIVAEGTGATVQGVKLPFVKSLQIPVPSLAEQRRIVAILDEAFDGIATAKANAEKNLQNARAIFESHLQSVFTEKAKKWPDRLLGDVFHIGSSKRIYETDWTAQGVPFFGGREIVKLAKYGSVQSASFISEEKYQEYASKYEMPQAGDILMTARGTIGVGYIVKPGDKFYYKDGNVISLRAKNPSNPQFVLYAFRSNAILDQLTVLVGTTVSHLPIEKAKMLKIFMPTFEVQNFIVEHLEMMEAHSKELESIYKQKLAALNELKKSLLHQAFSGAL
ncbi:MAG: restriction endonuclease subunit S [Polaromonas sp.]|uniref:restriction endonuclease subunit S n=1 Tax=Polaromonas sp. TaxID=1869339 RepID=UPI0027314D1F|nr:restriction endonuclease subunit S [Polaromonas sp.]MDP2450587.1 restriction endonuclease subunit S [Polaromonas sp.]MDP3247118.1 restriction endonuclease subunit S [Polaromonas sp.]MDP3755757.1 restriction endonuclease subunit S [Polaromonas sp.]